MLEVEEVELGITLADGPVGMVLMQPHIQIANPLREPFCWDSSAVNQQFAAIRRTLEVAAHPNRVGGHAAFTVFPEYAIPGPQGVRTIDEVIHGDGWPENSIVIGGVDGLTKAQYTDLVDDPSTIVHDSNSPDRIRNHEWVNCCITWARDNRGVRRRWIQPKLTPARPELNTRYQRMFKGGAVFVFTVTYGGMQDSCRFFTLICFDWVARNSNWKEVVTGLQPTMAGHMKTLDWIFVPQCNVKPNDQRFLDSTYEFLMTPNQGSVSRRDAAIIMSNVAAGPDPRREGNGGYSAVVFGSQTPFDRNRSRPTVCAYATKLRRETKLKRLKDSVFREMGPCVHSFTLHIPRFIQPDATDRHEPVEDAEVHCLDGRSDPRVPDGPVPAIVKWVNDELDDLPCYVRLVSLASDDVRDRTIEWHESCVKEYRVLHDRNLQERMDYSAASKTGTEEQVSETAWCPDLWETTESQALAHQIHTLALLRSACDVIIEGATLHGTLMHNEKPVEVVAIRGKTHAEIHAYAKNRLRDVNHRTIVISLDEAVSQINSKELEDITNIDEPQNRDDIKFTDPVAGRRLYDFASFRNAWQTAADETAVKEDICAVLGL